MVDIGGIRSDCVRLCEKEGEKAEYIALSHCWGISQPFTTTKVTKPLLEQSVEKARLPQTFQDACWLARHFGIRYLWVDSLCIIQDDQRDWEIQSARMASIYRDAFMTIAASRAESDAAGFLGLREPACALSGYSEAHGQKVPIYLSPTQLDARPELAGTLPYEPLSQRGWAVQEWYLSRRVLYHGSQQMYWACGETGYAEDHSDTKSYQFRSDGNYCRSRAQHLILHGKWINILEIYSSCRLTRYTDRLPVISGIASQYQRLTGDQYLAGLWYSHLPGSLLWCRSYGAKVEYQHRTLAYRAPS